jgi:hypothetical protein
MIVAYFPHFAAPLTITTAKTIIQPFSGMEVTNMKISILPKSAFGWWSIGLAIATIAFAFGVLQPILYQAAQQNNITLFAILSFIVAAIGGAASATGLISIIKRRQGAILVFISTAIGLVFLIVEFADAVQAMMGQGF